MKRVRLLTAAVLALLALLPGRFALAGCSGSIVITQVTPLAFGAWATTTTSNTKAVVTTSGATTGSTGTQLFGTITPGNYTVNETTHGSCSNTMTIDVSAMGGCGTSCSMGSITALWGGVSHTTFPFSVTTGDGTLNIGATATYGGAGMPTGSYTPAYTITITNVSGSTTITSGPTNQTASIAFDSQIGFSSPVGINYGYVQAGVVDDFTINTAGTLTHTGGALLEPGPTPNAGQVTISGSTTQPITISIGGTTASNGVSVTAERGKWGGAAEQNFPISGVAPGAGTILYVGATVHADGTQVDGTLASPSITINVVYQ
jgi:hypothetical protein